MQHTVFSSLRILLISLTAVSLSGCLEVPRLKGSTKSELSTTASERGCGSTLPGATESRTRFENPSVPFGQNCVAETQSRRCSNGSFTDWSGTYANPACSPLPAATPPPVLAPTPAPLLNEFRVFDYGQDGQARVLFSAPADTSNLGRLRITRRAGSAAPSSDCSGSDHVVANQSTFVAYSPIDAVEPGQSYTYRICLWNKSDVLLGSLLAQFTAAPLGSRVIIGTASDTPTSEVEFSGAYVLWQGNFGYLTACDTRIPAGSPFACDRNLDNRISAEIGGGSKAKIDGTVITYLSGTAVRVCDILKNGSAGGCGTFDAKVTISRTATTNREPSVSGRRVLWHEALPGSSTQNRILMCDIDLSSGEAGSCSAPTELLASTSRRFTISNSKVLSGRGFNINDHASPSYCDLDQNSCTDEGQYTALTAGSPFGSDGVIYGQGVAWRETETLNGNAVNSIFRCEFAKNGLAGGCLPNDSKTKIVERLTANAPTLTISSNRYLSWPNTAGQFYEYCDTSLTDGGNKLACFKESEKGTISDLSTVVTNRPVLSPNFIAYRGFSGGRVTILERR